MAKKLSVENRDEWRAWLRQHHKSEAEVWLVYYKKETGRPSIPYDDSVEEALCYGWIDSILQKIDDRRYARKFTPRKDHGKWSPSNIKRMRKLIGNGRMTKVGMAKFDPAILKQAAEEPPAKLRLVLPPSVKQTLMKNKRAWGNFNELAPFHRKRFIAWIVTAKREETRQRRVKETLALLAQNKKLPMK